MGRKSAVAILAKSGEFSVCEAMIRSMQMKGSIALNDKQSDAVFLAVKTGLRTPEDLRQRIIPDVRFFLGYLFGWHVKRKPKRNQKETTQLLDPSEPETSSTRGFDFESDPKEFFLTMQGPNQFEVDIV